MLTFIFPDGQKRQYPVNITGQEVAHSISPSLAKKALAVVLNGQQKDIYLPLTQSGDFRIITPQDPEALELIRHDTAHVMAEAVKELFPDTQVTIGPAIENGFYYDFFREQSFTPEDLEKIEVRMQEIVDRNESIRREVWERQKAIDFFLAQGETFKAEIIEDLPEDEDVSLYRQGNFIDLCRGPHVDSTKKIGKAFKLMKLAGAYWRGDHRNPMLQRIYGTAWTNEKDLKSYLQQLEEAEKRDHRKIGKETNLFHFQEEAMGSVFWHSKGWTVYRLLQDYMRTQLEKQGYIEVNTPEILDRKLWEASGHWAKFRENMFTIQDAEEHTLAIKPMSCPGHVQIFKQGLKSYRDLPLRMAEFGKCHRHEASGALHGLMRVRAFTQDDGHIFCRENQIAAETKIFCAFLIKIYKDLGFEDVFIKFSDRPEVRAGNDKTWDKAEGALKEAIESTDLFYTMNPGEGAFYGPKIEFVLKDAIGREWQCGTLQVDFVLPERLGAYYITEEGEKTHPVMLHRAVLGTFERFLGIMIEHYAGKFPLWLAPVQVVVATITQESHTYAQEVARKLSALGVRVESDLRNEKISYKVREHSHQKVQYILCIGAKEAETHTVSVRTLGSTKSEVYKLEDFCVYLEKEMQAPQ